MSLSVLGAVGLLTLTGAGRPASLSTAMDVRRAPEASDCPDAPALSSAIAGILGASGEEPAQSPSLPALVEVRVTFDRVQGDYRAAMVLQGARTGSRTLIDGGPTCAALGHAVAIALSLLLEESPTTTREPAANALPPVPERPPQSSGVSRVSGVSGFLALQAGPSWGAVGRASWGAGLALEARLGGHLSFLLTGEQVLSQTTALPPGTVAVSLRVAHLAACAGPEAAADVFKISACAVGSAGALQGQGRGFATSQSATMSWWAAGGALRAEALFRRRWLVALTASVEVPLHAYTFSAADAGTDLGTDAGKVSATRDTVEALQVGLGIRLW